jgi:hypothetical protein
VQGRETIYETRNGKFQHFNFLNKGTELKLPKSDDRDEYSMLDVTGVDRLLVTIRSVSGFLMLMTTDNYPIAVLCSSLPDIENKVYIHFGRYVVTKNIVSQLGLNDPLSGVSSALSKLLNANMMLYHDEVEEIDDETKIRMDQATEESELLGMMFSASSHLDDDGLDFDMDDMFAQLNEMEEDEPPDKEGLSVEEDTTDDELDNLPVKDAVSFWGTSTAGSYVSQYGVFQPTSTLLATKSIGQLVYVPQSARRKLPLVVQVEKTVCINLPFKTEREAYASGPTGTGLTELLSEISNLDSVESSWLVSYLRDCLVNSQKVMMDVKDVLKEDEDADEDWSDQ